MLPNLSPPVDRSELAQQGLTYRSDEQAFHATVGASEDAKCIACRAGCAILPFPLNLACNATCGATVC